MMRRPAAAGPRRAVLDRHDQIGPERVEDDREAGDGEDRGSDPDSPMRGRASAFGSRWRSTKSEGTAIPAKSTTAKPV